MSPNDADGMANSVEPDQTAPLGAVWSASALFAQAYLSENLGSLRYFFFNKFYFTSSFEKSKILAIVSLLATVCETHHEKTCFCHMPKTKAQNSLRICAVWAAPLLFAVWIV